MRDGPLADLIRLALLAQQTALTVAHATCTAWVKQPDGCSTAEEAGRGGERDARAHGEAVYRTTPKTSNAKAHTRILLTNPSQRLGFPQQQAPVEPDSGRAEVRT